MQNAPPQFQALGHSQDIIGWWQFLEGTQKAKLLQEQQGQQQTVSGKTTQGTGLVITNF
jgi:hypothetical protein